ncbi:hypothetical protein [Microbacterium schleiferi]|jgi:hypothetical protein|uniref:Uncharacterized protein n=1 Tax=Microbacterium schleiferi TaxID=69362 RepID=A0ABU7V6M7_9MICO
MAFFKNRGQEFIERGGRGRQGDTTLPARSIATDAQLIARRSMRSADIVASMKILDSAPNELAAQEIAEWLNGEFESRGGGALLGLFGHCYLGHPYADHLMTLDGSIIRHFTHAEPVPSGFEPARSLAVTDAYAYIEIYADGQIIPVRPDGIPAA